MENEEFSQELVDYCKSKLDSIFVDCLLAVMLEHPEGVADDENTARLVAIKMKSSLEHRKLEREMRDKHKPPPTP